MQGISLIANFDVNVPFPIDSRLVVNDTTERDNIIWKYEGLKVYVLSERQSYIWQDSVWRVEYNGIYGGSGSLPGNVTVDFGSMSTTVGSASYYFEYEVDSQNSYSYLQNQFIRHKAAVSGQTDAWQGIEFRQQLKYNNGTGLKDSSYVSFNPKSVLGGISFGTGDSLTNTVSERMAITGDGRVGISTNTPQSVLQIGSYSTTNELPLVFDIRTARGSSIGYNWHYTTTDQVFNKFKGSTRISSNTDGLTIFNRYSGSLPSYFTQSIHLSSVQSTWGNVGIRTTDPKGLLQIGPNSTTRKPLVFHNDTNAIIGYNWYYDTVDNVFDPTKPSLNINFEQSGGLNIKTRQLNTPASSFTSSLFVSTLNRVGINNTSPQHTLDVNGVINGSSDIQAQRDISSIRNIQVGNSVIFFSTTASFYRIVPSPQSLNAIDFQVGILSSDTTFRMADQKIISFKQFEVHDNNLLIYQQNNTINSKLDNGIVFCGGGNSSGSVIYPYQGSSNNVVGLSMYALDGAYDRESLRISNGGKRIQIGVPSNVTTAHNLDTSSQIDTNNSMYTTHTSQLTPVTGANLLQSGLYTYNPTLQITVYQRWIRVGLMVSVQIRITNTSGGTIQNNINITTPFSGVQAAQGFFVAENSGGNINATIKGIFVKHPSNNTSIVLRTQDENIFSSTSWTYIDGSYTFQLA